MPAPPRAATGSVAVPDVSVPEIPAVPFTAAATPTGRASTHHRAVVRRGWLEKKGGDTHIDASNVLHKERHYSKGGRRNWKARWFIMYADGELAYFNSGPRDDHDTLWHEGEPDAGALKGRMRLLGAAGGCCCWHVRGEGSDEFLLALPNDSGKDVRDGLLMRHTDEGERQLWVEATVEAFGATVAPLVEDGEERGLAERAAMGLKARVGQSLAGDGARNVAARLPPTEGVALFDFVAEHPDDLGLAKGTVVVLTETDGEWWHGHVVGVPGVVGMFPASFVARGEGPPEGTAPPPGPVFPLFL